MKSKLVKNVIFGFGGQVVVIVLGIIVSRIMLTSYGSDVNGLISTVTQIFTYMALLEAGIGQATRNALYKPVLEGDRDGCSYVASVSRRYFRRITVFYGIGVILLSAVVPFVLKSQVEKSTICLVILLQGASGVISFYFIQTQTLILASDGKSYINNGVNTLNQILNYSARIVLASLGVNIVLLQFVYFVLTVGKVAIYKIYFKRHYEWINYKAAPKTATLPDRYSYILTEVAWTVFSSTDMIVLSVFVSTQLSSVYAVYNLVFNNLNVLLSAVFWSVNYILGQAFHENKEKHVKLYDAYTSVFLGGMTILMCAAYVLVLPFIKLYTQGVTDVEYIYPSLPVLLCLVQIISWSRVVADSVIAIAGYVKNTIKISILEAVMNVVLSVILVNKLGIVGVLIATVLALPVKAIYCIHLVNKKVLKRSSGRTASIIGINFLLFSITVLVNQYISLPIENYLDFIKYGIIVTAVCMVVGVSANVLVNPECGKIVNIFRGRK